MNKLFFNLVFILCFGQLIRSQDLIVSKSNDSIQCKITKLKKNDIYFVFNNNGEFQSTMIPNAQVALYRYDFYSENIIPEEELPGYLDYSRIRISLSGGYSYDPGKLDGSFPNEYRPHFNALRSGYNFESSFYYYLDKYIGVGLKYNFMKASNTSNNAIFGHGGNQFSGILRDKISVSFVGLSFSIRFVGKNTKTAFFLNSAIGYLFYKNDQTVLLDSFNVSGNTFGAVSEIGYDFEISKNLYLGIQLGLTAGKINKVEIKDGSNIEVVELENNTRMQGSGRIDSSVGLRLNL